MIRRNVELEARLIDDLLDVMRIVRGKLPLHWEVADAHQPIDQRARDLPRARSAARRLRLDARPGGAAATTSTPTRPGSSRCSGT